MSVLDLQALCDEVPLHRRLELQVSRGGEGVVFKASVGTDFVVTGGRGIVHGGIVATLLDIAATFALISATGHDWVTVDLRVDYLRPVLVGTVAITGHVLRAGRTVGRAQAVLTDATGNMCATAVGTFAPGGEAGSGSSQTVEEEDR